MVTTSVIVRWAVVLGFCSLAVSHPADWSKAIAQADEIVNCGGTVPTGVLLLQPVSMGGEPMAGLIVADPAVPSTNNAAERALRPLVIARKISGGTRSPGTLWVWSRTRMILQSLIATWDLRAQDPVTAMRELLQAPRIPAGTLAPV